MQLVDGPEESLRPLNVGILMFSENPEKYFRYARIEIVDIPDPTGTNMVEKTFTGPIQRQLTDSAIASQNIRARIYRNRRIGDYLKELKLIEGRNTGFPNARKALSDANRIIS